MPIIHVWVYLQTFLFRSSILVKFVEPQVEIFPRAEKETFDNIMPSSRARWVPRLLLPLVFFLCLLFYFAPTFLGCVQMSGYSNELPRRQIEADDKTESVPGRTPKQVYGRYLFDTVGVS